MSSLYLTEQVKDITKKEIPLWLKHLIRERFVTRPYKYSGKEYSLGNLDSDLYFYDKEVHNYAYGHKSDRLRGSFGAKKSNSISKKYRNFLCLYAADLPWDALCVREKKTEDENYYDPKFVDPDKPQKKMRQRKKAPRMNWVKFWQEWNPFKTS